MNLAEVRASHVLVWTGGAHRQSVNWRWMGAAFITPGVNRGRTHGE